MRCQIIDSIFRKFNLDVGQGRFCQSWPAGLTPNMLIWFMYWGLVILGHPSHAIKTSVAVRVTPCTAQVDKWLSMFGSPPAPPAGRLIMQCAQSTGTTVTVDAVA